MWTELNNFINIGILPPQYIEEIYIDEIPWKGYNVKNFIKTDKAEKVIFLGDEEQFAAVSIKEISDSKVYLMVEKNGEALYQQEGKFRLVLIGEKFRRRWCKGVTKYRILGDEI